MSFTLHVNNLRALRKVEWSPEGVTALVGPNGAGKSTLLLALKLLQLSARRGIEEGFRHSFGGSYGLRSRSATEDDRVSVGLEFEDLSWELELEPEGATIFSPAAEQLEVDSSPSRSWFRNPGGASVILQAANESQAGNVTLNTGSAYNLAIDLLARHGQGQTKADAKSILDILLGVRVFHDPALWSLRTQGSSTATTADLHSRSTNAFAMLRMWNERREHRHRYQFVHEGLRNAFPANCDDLDFESAGQTTVVRVWPPNSELPVPIANEANGLLAMLVYLCNIASSDPGGLVAIDEPENSLHPFALRELIENARAWSEAHDTTIVLATHSPVILDTLGPDPTKIWVMRSDAGPAPNPIRLDRLKNPDWLRNFTLGTLLATGELGSNDDAAA